MAEITPDSVETQGLLREAAAGDRRAFDQLLARHRKSLCKFVELRMDPKMRTRVDASDVVQETQLEAFRRLPDFLKRQPMPFHVWLRKTAYERLLMARRQHVGADQRSVGREVPLPDRSSLLLAARLVPKGSTPSQRLGRRELALRVHQILQRLAASDREILLMRNIEERSYQEIACILDLDLTAARKRYGRALFRLHELLVDDGLTGSQP
jgi:RNA polymerase sigma-70 factor (ECF subfamily)